jgi:hypothetical protein
VSEITFIEAVMRDLESGAEGHSRRASGVNIPKSIAPPQHEVSLYFDNPERSFARRWQPNASDARLDSSDKGAPERRIAFQQFAST